MESQIQKINSDEFIDRVVMPKADALVKITTAFNGAGQILNQTLQDLAKQYNGKVDFFSIDFEANSALSLTYRVDTLPTLLFFKKGTLVDRLSGLSRKTVISQKVQHLVNSLNQ